MPQSCEEHKDRPQVSCEVCYPDDELKAGLARMQAVRVPSAPTGSAPRKKPKRLDDLPSKKKSWRDDMFG